MYLQRINLDGNVLLVYDHGVVRAALRVSFWECLPLRWKDFAMETLDSRHSLRIEIVAQESCMDCSHIWWGNALKRSAYVSP